MSCCDTKNNEKQLCYCFNITESAYIEAIKQGKENVLKGFAVFQTKHNYCHCKNLNPSGQCCLKDFKILDNSRTN
ncbi:conserved hypothetical protein [Isorropodon fossajaponicum endosymbiont JTNG4]|nr:conserved hypothetical protein [Isorropodon fossajaponicum endosymbiont JTNG4]